MDPEPTNYVNYPIRAVSRIKIIIDKKEEEEMKELIWWMS